MDELPALEGDAFESGAPMTESGGGDFFSQELGTLLRLRYNTESYGQDRRGNLDIGTMQVANFQDAITFFDGQVTLSDVNGVGYNLGVGFRWLGWTPFPLEPERITGFNFWADGTSTESGNFFPQVGVGFESLGDMWDLRVNGYIPVGKETQIGEFSSTGAISFDENFLVQEAIADRNTSFNVAEAEIARRIMRDRDAWAFAGPYVLGNDDQDAAGYRVGMRGYAYPDLLLQIAVTDDDIFKTNAAFSVTWFVGRTRNNFQPAAGLPDRMREPVMRNDYVALQRTIEVGGGALTNTDGDPLRFVHVDADAPAGGDGTFENPLNNIGNVNDNSQEDDIILLYSDGTFTGQSTLVLQDNQRLLGEGNGEFFTVNTLQQGVVVIPETSPGARDGMRPIILNALGGAVQLADANEVANFNINGGAGAGIFSPGTGAGNPNIHDIDMANVTGTGIQFTPLTRIDEDNMLLMTVAGNVTIDDVSFLNMGGVEIDINSFTTADVLSPNVTLQETIAISDVDSQEGNNRGLRLRNTHDNRTATITNYLNGTAGVAGSGGGLGGVGVLVFEGSSTDEFDGNVTLTNIDVFNNEGFALDFSNIDATSATTITSGNGLTYNGGAGAAGGMQFNNFNGTITANSSTLTNGTLAGVRIIGDSDGTFTFANTVTFTNIDGTTIDIDGGATDQFTGVATFSGDITNDAGRSVSIQGISGAGTSVTIAGDITETDVSASEGILINSNSGGTVLFSGDITQDLTANDGIELTANTGTDISFGGVLDIDIDGAGRAFTATGGGTLTVSNTSNTVNTENGPAVQIEGMTISAAGANFADVNVAGSTTNGVRLVDNTGGPILIGTVGDDAGESGTIALTTQAAVLIDNSANVTVSGLIINTVAGQTGVSVVKDTIGTQTVNLNDLDINNGATGVDVTGNGTGTLNMTVNDTTIDNVTSRGININNIDAGTIQVNGTTIDGDDTTALAQGVLITDSNASISFDAATVIQQFDNTDFEVNGGTGTISYAGDINNTTGRSVNVHDITGGSVQFTAASTITDSGTGILVENNGTGSVSFLGTNNLDTTTNTAVTLTNNDVGGTNSAITFASLDITTTGTGAGLVATGGGTLSTTGTNNRIDTEDGTGLQLTDMNIGSVDFASVNVDDGTGGPVNAILLQNLTGGQVEIGTSTGADGSGGTLRSTGDAIVITNAANVALHDIVVADSDGHAIAVTKSNTAAMTVTTDNVDVTDAVNDGVNVSVTGSGQVNLTVTDSNFATLGGQAVDLAANTTANDVNVTINNLTTTDGIEIDAEDNAVVDFRVNGSNITGNVVATTIDSAALDYRFANSTIVGSTTMNVNGSGNFDMLVENSSITTAGAVNGIVLAFGANSQDADVIIRNNTTFDAAAGQALVVTANGTNADIDFLLSGNDMSDGGALATVDIQVSGGATFEANVVNNTIANSGGDELFMFSDGSSTRIDLDLDNNNAGAAGIYHLRTDNQGVPTVDFNFGVVDRDSADANNVGTINFDPAANEFEDITGPVPLPVLP